MISYRRVEKESDELLYTVWSLVMVRANQLPTQEVKRSAFNKNVDDIFLWKHQNIRLILLILNYDIINFKWQYYFKLNFVQFDRFLPDCSQRIAKCQIEYRRVSKQRQTFIKRLTILWTIGFPRYHVRKQDSSIFMSDFMTDISHESKSDSQMSCEFSIRPTVRRRDTHVRTHVRMYTCTYVHMYICR